MYTMKKYNKQLYYCCNPFSAHANWKKQQNLEPVSEFLRTLYPSIKDGDQVCKSCRVRCYRERGTGKSVQNVKKTNRKRDYKEQDDSLLGRNLNQNVVKEQVEENLFSTSECNNKLEETDLTSEFKNEVWFKDELHSILDINQSVDNEQVEENLNNPLEESVKIEECDFTLEITNEDTSSSQLISKEDLNKKKDHFMSIVNSMLIEFDEIPIDSSDYSIVGGIERKVDILANKLKFLFINNFISDK
ncbi:uncharacterized protein LOC127287599 [Leptopilina boulardi]|uniref:uncharacterized protein LOC127287599 n=1 Tax=Leptopilina boulardi TaxID=63433 RepID=UPI0021F5EF6E|nr:uncharacterized protein LOC127287599 [Leptopilina boulardi]